MSYHLQLWPRSLLQKSWQLINYLTEEHSCYNKTTITPPLQLEKKWTGHLHIIFNQQPQKHKPPSLKWVPWWGFSGLWEMPDSCRGRPPSQGYPSATLCPAHSRSSQPLVIHFLNSLNFFLLPCSRGMLEWGSFTISSTSPQKSCGSTFCCFDAVFTIPFCQTCY